MLEKSLIEQRGTGTEMLSDEQLDTIAEAIAFDVIPERGRAMADHITAVAPARLPAIRADRARFQETISGEWGTALDPLQVLVHEFYHFGRDLLIGAVKDGTAKSDRTIQVLGRLHARALRTATEVLCLLETGLADGAFGRWRTLHEIAMVALVLSDYGPELVERYQFHEAVRIQRALGEFANHHAALGWAPISDSERGAADTQVEQLRRRFGSVFTRDFGWIAGIVPLQNAGRPSLADIERAVKLDTLRPLFGWASESIHGGPLGLRSLGMPAYAGDVLYAGGSTSGLAD